MSNMNIASLFVQRLQDNVSLHLEGINIICRTSDGYINATQLCKAGGKELWSWNQNAKSKLFINKLSSTLHIPVGQLIVYKDNGPKDRSTWVHPRVAINIAQWLSPDIDVLVGNWIHSLQSTIGIQRDTIDYLIQRVESLECQNDLQLQINRLTEELNATRVKLDELERKEGVIQGEIYTIRCNSCDSVYIGSSTDSRARFNEHVNNFSVKDSFSAHMKEHGRQAMELVNVVVHTVRDRDELYMHEEEAIVNMRLKVGKEKVMNKLLPKRKVNSNRRV